MSSVLVSNLTADTTDLQLREFFSYCGDIQDIRITSPSTAVIQFAKCESVEIATLLTGAAVNGSAIVVSDVPPAGGLASPASPVRPSAVQSVDRLSAAGLLAGAGNVIDSIRDKAVALDEKYGIRAALSNGVTSAVRSVDGLVKYVTGRNDKGDVQVACWYWKENQPQWGEDPRMCHTNRGEVATDPKIV
eukprot:CAMPEP_0176405706 /NCGR_PEP_ID=MMETSP0127-20121128/481_1 /TAXON_ID=938130 /ORGANISM="Platyophrya macrostoma, Strain WH" /LENGTH=189 /DNA_ID=CAMNT_0017784783 /DNA_START=14 /DNA_END=583 /DNA_ORIENTATION=+